MFSFPVEVVLKGRDFAVTEQVAVDVPGPPSGWADEHVRDVLVEILRSIDRAENPKTAGDRIIVLRGFSWIVEPAGNEHDVVIAIEIPMGAAVAGPFPANQADLTDRITRVLKLERQLTTAPGTVH